MVAVLVSRDRASIHGVLGGRTGPRNRSVDRLDDGDYAATHAATT